MTVLTSDELLTSEIDSYLQRLFPLCRSITGNPNRKTLKILQEIIPLKIVEVPTGTKVYDWEVPVEWNIKDAYIAKQDGTRVVDFNESNLHVVSYSEPVDAFMTWEELEPHLHIHDQLKEAVPYRTSYYKRTWGFCCTHEQYKTLKNYGEKFRVVIDSEFKSGSLTYGEYLLPGKSAKEILISCYICHPSMANDSLSGVILTAFLARHLSNLPDRQWSYRIIFVPETIGAITYCCKNEAAMKNIDFGFVITTVGGPGVAGYKQSFDDRHFINRLTEDALSFQSGEFITYPFDIHGSDERQYSSIGFRINTISITKDKYYEYAYYHSSLDDLDFVKAENIEESLKLYLELVERVEQEIIYRNKLPYCEVMLSKHNLYPQTGGALLPGSSNINSLDIRLWLLFLCDGKKTVSDIAAELSLEPGILLQSAVELESLGVLERY